MEFHRFRVVQPIITFLIIFIFSISSIFGQAKEETDRYSSKKNSFRLDPDRIVVGGGFGAQFGDITLLEISPTFGYLVDDNWLVGIGGRYIYYEERFFTSSFSTNIYGANLFSQYFFQESFIGHIEYELLNLEDFSAPDSRVNVSSLFVGPGYRTMIGNTSYLSVLLLYNLIHDEATSPYPDPLLFRVNFGFGLR